MCTVVLLVGHQIQQYLGPQHMYQTNTSNLLAAVNPAASKNPELMRIAFATPSNARPPRVSMLLHLFQCTKAGRLQKKGAPTGASRPLRGM